MGSADINHVCGLFNRSKEYWSLSILVRSFEKKIKINRQGKIRSEKADYARGKP